MGITLENKPLTDAWVDELVAACADVAPTGARPATVTLTIGKKSSATLEIAEGRIVGPGDDGAARVSVPVTADQLASFLDGRESMARAYTRGDLKPVGASGPLLSLIEAFDAIGQADNG